MTDLNKLLAKIEKASLNMDRGFLTLGITVNYEDGWNQNISGLVLDTYDKETEKRVGTLYGGMMIRECLATLGVNDLSEAKGLHIWVYAEGEGLSLKPKGFSRLYVDGGGDILFYDDIAKAAGIEQ